MIVVLPRTFPSGTFFDFLRRANRSAYDPGGRPLCRGAGITREPSSMTNARRNGRTNWEGFPRHRGWGRPR